MTVVWIAVGKFVALVVIGNKYSALARRCNFEEVEWVRTGFSKQADRCSFIRRAERLSGIFHECEFMLLANGHDLIDAGHSSTHMNQENCFCFWCDRGLNSFRSQAKGFVYLGENGKCATEKDSFYRSDIGKRWDDDLIACTNSRCGKRAGYGRRTAGNGMSVRCSRDFLYFVFKIARFPDVFALRLMVVAEENARFKHIVNFFLFFGSK